MALDLGDRIRGFFTDNLNLKLLALGFTLVLYSLVHGSQDAQRSMAVSLVMLLPPESANRVLVNQIPPQVRVTVRGPRSVLDDLRAEEIGNIQVDVHTGADRRVTLDPQMVHVPPGLRVEQIDPPALDLEWEEQIVRDVAVQISVVGTPASGFVVKGQPTADPSTVRVHGPKSEVQVLQHVRAEAIDVSGLTEGRYQRHLAIDRPRGRMTLEMTSVLVVAEVTREVVERLFSKTPVAVIGTTKARTQPAEVDVRLVCPPEIVRALRPEQVVPRVEVKSDAHPGSQSLPVTVAVAGCEAHVTPADLIVRW